MLTRRLEARGLFHKYSFIRGKNSMQEGHLNVELVKVPVECCSEMGDCSEGLES